MNPAALVPYENNTKTHPPEQVDRIAESIKRFGWQQPIVVDRDNVVIIGHGRLMAAKQLMLDTVPVVYADNLTEEEAQALRLADNKTNESPWDFGKLEEELAALSIAGIDMTAFGFDALADELPPGDLDNPETYGETLACKLTFDNFKEYNEHETEIKEFAESIGATFSVVKA
jgi:site-specific DNA-methyltransferase (adenine-specific)